MAEASRVRVLYIIGIEDRNEIEVIFLSPDPTRCQYRYLGNVDLITLIDPGEFEVTELVCGDVEADEARIADVDVIVNAVCDPDTNRHALDLVAGIQRQLGVPIVNRPDRVLETTRDRLSQSLSSLPGATVTTGRRTIRVIRCGAMSAGISPDASSTKASRSCMRPSVDSNQR